MNTLSYTQRFFLCGINDKGNIPVLASEFPACLLAGSMMELLRGGYIIRDEKNKLIPGKRWDDSLSYLQPLYDTIVSWEKPKNINALADIYAFGLNQKSFNELFSAIGESAVELGYADEVTKQGILKEKIKYIPKAEAVTSIIEKVRAEFLGSEAIDEDTLCLAVLLDKGEIIRNYFSKVEKDAVKKRIKEVRASDTYASVKDIFDYVDGMIAAMVAIMSAIS